VLTRLTRQQPWSAQIGCTLVLALVVAAPGLFVGYMTYVHEHGDNRSAYFIFASVWIVVAVGLLAGGIHQLIAVRSPETIVEIDPSTLVPGSSIRVRVTQPGPLNLRSLHANLAGEEIEYYYAKGGLLPAEGTKRTTKVRYHGPFRIVEIDRCVIADGMRVQREVMFTVPAIPASAETTDLKIRWKIEVWGRVSLWPNFMHPFPVQVAAVQGSDDTNPTGPSGGC